MKAEQEKKNHGPGMQAKVTLHFQPIRIYHETECGTHTQKREIVSFMHTCSSRHLLE